MAASGSPSRASNAKPRFERQAPDARRRALVDATIASLKRHGHDGLSVRRIAAQAGVSVGLINHHFPNKDELVAEAFRHFYRQLIDEQARAVAGASASPRARLHAFFKATFSAPNLDRDVLTAWIVFWSLHRHSVEIQRAHDDTYRHYIELVRGLLGALAESGKLRMSLRAASIGLAALLDGLWLTWCLDPDTFSPREGIQLCEAWIDGLCEAP